jgi:glucoamylase
VKLLQEGLLARGDLFMARLRLHTPVDGSMAEQFARKDGQPVSARDLTWSYASFLSALKSRKALFE